MKNTIGFVMILLCFLLTQLSFSTYLPTTPTLAKQFGMSGQAIMLTLSIGFIGYAIGQLFWGTLSDYLGRKKMVLTSLFFYTLAAWLVANSQHYMAFCLTYAVLGFTAAAYTSIGNAIVRDIFTTPVSVTRAIAIIGIFMASGPMLGPWIGSHLAAQFNWQAIIFIFLSVVSALLFIGVCLLLPETQHAHARAQQQSLITAYKKLLLHRVYMGNLFILGVTFGAMFSFLNMAPFIYTHYLHLTLLNTGRMMAMAISGLVCGAVIVLFLVKHVPLHRLVAIGLSLILVGGVGVTVLAYFHCQQLVWVILVLLVSGLGFGITIPATKSGAMRIFKQNAGAASSMMKFTQTSLCIIMVTVSSYWHSGLSLYPLALLIVSASLIGLVLLQRMLRRPS